MKETLLTGLNVVLMLNLFFVLLSFFWFAVALLGRATDVPLGFDLWYRLWEPVFTPAIGLLMAGSLTVGVVNWLNAKLQAKSK